MATLIPNFGRLATTQDNPSAADVPSDDLHGYPARCCSRCGACTAIANALVLDLRRPPLTARQGRAILCADCAERWALWMASGKVEV